MLCLLKITLLDVTRSIWRRFVLPSDVSIAELHRVVQAVMGWHYAHLHEFTIGETRFGPVGMGLDLAPEVQDEEKFRLGDLVERGSRIRYWYDFGDDWVLDAQCSR